jgi:2-polyprenyl-3-methyl-5-hydroxy-6-metoxy-1,4-benzoquinol methylase
VSATLTQGWFPVLDVLFAADRNRRAKFACRICGQHGGLHLLDAVTPGRTFELFECPGCGSFFFDGADPALRYTEMEMRDELWLDYVQAGAGISNMLTPLFAFDLAPYRSLLDSGCGFGFVVDFWASRGGKATGLEPSNYGEIGSEKLGIDVRSQYLDEFLSENREARFDIVYSSEVIEHTPDPDAYAGSLVEAVTDNGVIVVTTPAISAIHANADVGAMIAALSPGFHFGIISPEALKGFFTRRGLYCRVLEHENQTLCWASRKPLPAIDPSKFSWRDYFNYLETLSGNENPHLSAGALSRLFKDALNTGDEAWAAAAYDRLTRVALDYYGLDLENPEIGALLEMRKPLSGLNRFPSWLGGALLFGGLHVGHSRNDRRTKLRMLDAALKVLARRADVDRQFGQEAMHFLPFAERQYVIALSEALTVSLCSAEGTSEGDLRHTLKGLTSVLDQFLAAPSELTVHDAR